LVRSLLVRLSGYTGAIESDLSANEEILLDTQIDGRRYVLIRMSNTESCALCLSPREQEIVRMVAKGYPTKIIADILNISSWTVCTHLRRIFVKLGVGSRTAMLARLLKESWVWDFPPPSRSTPRASDGADLAARPARELDQAPKPNPHGPRARPNLSPGLRGVQQKREPERVL
jgi:DNA-binding CsgD family transcriptional regulator